MGEHFSSGHMLFYPVLERVRQFSGASVLRMSQELIYERLFDRLLVEMGLPNTYRPIKHASNFSLLYLIAAAVKDLPVESVAELGAGQSTYLLDSLSTLRPLKIVSIEHEPDWQRLIQERVSHAVVHAPLERRKVHGYETKTYAASAIPDINVDMLVIDGPYGSKKRSRWGAVEFVERLIGDDYIVIMDDVQRVGEMQTANAIQKLLASKRNPLRVSETKAAKNQILFCAGKFEGAAFL